MFDGPADLFSRALARPDTAAVLTTAPNFSTVIAMTLLSTVAIILLPRQFHVTVVENHSEAEIRRARWMFPLYLVLINLFVVPIALAGLLTFPAGQVDSDMFVLALPLSAEASVVHDHRLHRRTVGRDRDGDRRIGRAGDHGVERSGGAVLPEAAVANW